MIFDGHDGIPGKPICINPITGRTVWLLRHIPSGEFGGDVDWVTNAVKPHWFSKTVETYGLCGQGMNKNTLIELADHLHNNMPFERVRAQRNGRWRYYSNPRLGKFKITANFEGTI